MPYKQVLFRSEAREKVLRGATALTDGLGGEPAAPDRGDAHRGSRGKGAQDCSDGVTALAPTSPEGKNMPSRYSVVCRSCRYQSSHSSRWEASIDVAAHLRDNPTHSVTVVEEGLGAYEAEASSGERSPR